MVSVARVLRSEPAATPRWYGIAASCDEMEFDRDDLARSFHIGERFSIVPKIEVFNLFNNKNNISPLTTPGLFNFDGFLRVGVGDPRQAQLSARFVF